MRLMLLAICSAGLLRLNAGVPRLFDEPQRESVLPVIRHMAQLQGLDPEQVVRDALPLQYVVRMVAA